MNDYYNWMVETPDGQFTRTSEQLTLEQWLRDRPVKRIIFSPNGENVLPTIRIPVDPETRFYLHRLKLPDHCDLWRHDKYMPQIELPVTHWQVFGTEKFGIKVEVRVNLKSGDVELVRL